jgi:DNA-binding MarR family transcriptional regulator
MAAIRLTRTLRSLNRGGRLSGPQISALAVIVYSKRVSARDLAVFEEVSAAAISKLVKQMESDGLVRRSPDPADARLQWISATAKGVRLVREGHERRIAPLVAAIGDLPTGRRAAIVDACAIIEGMTKAARGA